MIRTYPRPAKNKQSRSLQKKETTDLTISDHENKLKKKTLSAVNMQIMLKSAELIRAGISVALGQNFVYRIDEEFDSKGKSTGRKHVLVTEPEEIASALDKIQLGGESEDDQYYYITTKEPDHKAIEMLLNRAFGKPKESLTVDGEVQFSLKALAKRRSELTETNNSSSVIDVEVISEEIKND